MGAMDLVAAKDQGSASSSSSPPCQDMDMSESNKKCCVDCKTTKTPLWRSGPAGPKSLCNACGIRYRKKRASLGLSKGAEKNKERAIEAQSNENGESTAASEGGLSESMQKKLVALGKDLLNPAKKQRCRRREKMGEEEEQAAVCLLAMSCGYVFA